MALVACPQPACGEIPSVGVEDLTSGVVHVGRERDRFRLIAVCVPKDEVAVPVCFHRDPPPPGKGSYVCRDGAFMKGRRG